MGMCPEEMERWGTASIFKESARLLHKHYRLFLPFFLAFYLVRSMAPKYETVCVLLSSTLPDPSAVEGSVNTAQTINPPGDQSFTIFLWTLLLKLLIYVEETLGGVSHIRTYVCTPTFSWILLKLLIYVVGTLSTGAVSYITAYLYTPTDTDDDRSIVPKVFEFLPHAFLRMFITRLWIVLAVFFSVFIAVMLAVMLAIILASAGWSNPNPLFSTLFALFLILAGIIFCCRYSYIHPPRSFSIHQFRIYYIYMSSDSLNTIFIITLSLFAVSVFSSVSFSIESPAETAEYPVPLWIYYFIFLTIVFALAEVIAVLEPGNYGRKALKRSTKLARIGRAGTIVAVTFIWIVLSKVLIVLTNRIMTGGMPVWAKAVLGVVIGGLDSVFRVYFGVVWVVMYFVYKARFDAAESAD